MGKTRSTTSTRFFQYEVLLTREPASYWRENMMAVAILPPVLARMSWWREQVIKRKKFYHFDIGRGLKLFSINDRTNFFGEKKSKMKLSGEFFLRARVKKL